MPIWKNDQTALFVLKQGEEFPQYLWNVQEIGIIDKIENRIIVKFYMPCNSWKEIENGCTLFVTVRPKGACPDVFDNGEIFAVCRNCRIAQTFSEDVKTWYSSQITSIDITMTIDCDIEFMPEGVDKTE